MTSAEARAHVESLPPDLQALFLAKAAKYSVLVSEMLSKQRGQRFAARQELYAALRALGYTWEAIAYLTCRDDHTSILKGVQRYHQRMGCSLQAHQLAGGL